MNRPFRMGMVGGGPGSFIGPIHHMAAELDGCFELVAGAFSSDAEKSPAAAELYGIARERSYSNYDAMFMVEQQRSDGVEVIVIVTPNHLHSTVAIAALKAGLHVFSEKPATTTLTEALELRRAIRAADRVYALNYTYTGYAMVREARALVAGGKIGAVRKVVVDYPQGWLSERLP